MLFGFLAGCFLVLAFCLHNLKRARIHQDWELKPNLLLTRHPLVFLSGKRSFFYFLSYWNHLPQMLRAHGYETQVLHLPWKNTKSRRLWLHHFLLSSSQSLHLVIDNSSYPELTDLIRHQNYPCIASITWIQNGVLLQNTPTLKGFHHPLEELSEIEVSTKSPWFWKLHLLVTNQPLSWSLSALGWQMQKSLRDIFLDRVKFLAERDLIQGSTSPNL